MKDIYIGKVKGPSVGEVILGGFFLVLSVSFLLFTIIVHEPVKGIFFSVPVLILALFISQKKGTMIDFTKGLYQEYRGFFAFKFGQWEHLPPVTNLLLFDIVKRTFSDSRYKWRKTVQTEIIYRTTLYNAQTDFAFIVSNSSNRNTALKQAQELAKRLQIPLEIQLKEE